MNREEAIEILKGAIKKPNTKDGYLGQALTMGIEALENQKTGHWIAEVDKWGDVVTTINGYKCSVCGGKRTGKTGDWIQIHDCKYPYCPDCGAKMEGE